MTKKDLPKIIPIFPLSKAIFFPRTILPLNIFEERYLQLVNDCMKESRMFGMIQPKNKFKKNPQLYTVGCLGKISSCIQTNDKRYLITLSGITRFRIKEEVNSEKLYRKFVVDYSEFVKDLEYKKNYSLNFNKNNLLKKIQLFFKKMNYSLEYQELLKLNFDQLISTVCMIAPFSIEEKQKIIETIKIEDKLNSLEKIINFNLASAEINQTIQ